MAANNISQKLHFVLIPLLAQGHMIPMIDMARLFAEHGVKVSLVTTPHNASRFATIINRAREMGLDIELIQIPFPSEQVGLPIGCENLDSDHVSVSRGLQKQPTKIPVQDFRKVGNSRNQLPGAFVQLPDLDDIRGQMQEAESNYGVVVNSFTELQTWMC
ncbi:hypothetical protein HAX54_018689 [Datura stramonium]|uniref:Uncharacterized protein n=1 Tax=Datura stramonium TaxID=4076 RepID=A0ABS8UPV6_DATST|nr:hypothetical protein [Datura stramonium]